MTHGECDDGDGRITYMMAYDEVIISYVAGNYPLIRT